MLRVSQSSLWTGFFKKKNKEDSNASNKPLEATINRYLIITLVTAPFMLHLIPAPRHRDTVKPSESPLYGLRVLFVIVD
jgi:hypothetical protein